MPNRLAGETSPYLLQHADNPVDWFPWGPEALEKARREGKPLLVSIGYSACHWCHVMAHESFEDQATAGLMNEDFVCIKVDREEHPDVDAIYMEAVQALTGQGGWPLNVFLTPDQRPFFGGTYFPPEPRHGMPSWKQVLVQVARGYREQPEDVAHNANALTEYIRRAQELTLAGDQLDASILQDSFQNVQRQFDWTNGGFGGSPKFPQPLALDFLLRMHARYADPDALSFVLFTLEKMACGGIYDQLGGGFHRYSVDARWVVPHFEKMLYDNALLARVYLHAWQITHNVTHREVVEQTLDYLLQHMCSPEGGFYAAEDADSEGVEGKFYVWTPEEMEGILGPERARSAALHYGVEESGNFEGKTILTSALSVDEIAARTRADRNEVREALREAKPMMLGGRSHRVPPGKDTKILVGWNGLAIRALAEAGIAFDRSDYLQAARRAADFILEKMRPGGKLIRSYRDGPGSVHAFLEDYASLIEALIALYEASSEPRYFQEARQLADEMIDRFRDPSIGSFFDTDGSGDLLVRPRSLYDNPIPSGNSSASFALLRLEAFTGDSTYRDLASPGLGSVVELMKRAPLAFSYMLSALDFLLAVPKQIAIVGPDSGERRELVTEVFTRYLPNAVTALGEAASDEIPLLTGREALDGRPTAYVCERFACRLPVTTREALAEQLA